MKEFFTRAAANNGRRLKLTLPSGEPSEHWLHIIGIDSDTFRKAQAIQHRNTMEASSSVDAGDITQEEAEDAYDTSRTALISSLITEWSFDKPCNPKAVIKFLTEAPQIATAVNLFAGTRKEFFSVGSEDYTDTQKGKKPSTVLSPDPNLVKEAT